MRLANLTIPLGTQLSNEQDVTGISSMSFYGPAALTAVVTVEASPDDGVTWFPTATVITVDVITFLSPVEATRIRLNSAGNEAADRVIAVHASSPNIGA